MRRIERLTTAQMLEHIDALAPAEARLCVSSAIMLLAVLAVEHGAVPKLGARIGDLIRTGETETGRRAAMALVKTLMLYIESAEAHVTDHHDGRLT